MGTAARRRLWALSVGSAIVAGLLATARPTAAQSGPEPEWLAVANRYRASAGLGPVTENPEASRGAVLHSAYLARNRQRGHSEDPARPSFSAEGLRAGMTGNVYTGSGRAIPGERYFIEGWMAAPFHGLGMLDPDSTSFGYGVAGTSRYFAATLALFWEAYSDPEEPGGGADLDGAYQLVAAQYPELANQGWEAGGAGGDRVEVGVGGRRFLVVKGVVREIDPTTAGALDARSDHATVVWPGDRTAVPLNRYSGNESPDPISGCPGYTRAAGLPVLIRRSRPAEILKASMVDGTGAGQKLCTLTAGTFTSRDGESQDFIRYMLGSVNGAVLIPQKPLTPGRSYTMDVTFTDGEHISWTFAVATDGAIGLPPDHPLAGRATRGVPSQVGPRPKR